MIPVKSKGIRSIAYDPVARTLDIEFSSSKIYRYRVESKGRFVNRLVKDKYRYERIDGPSAADTDLLDRLQKSLDERSSDD